jgi:hypothetical protein
LFEPHPRTAGDATTILTQGVASWGIDYMHLAKYNDRWLIVNVIYQGHPGEN